MKKISIIITSLFVILFVFTGCSNTTKDTQINSFEDCVKVGGNVAESYPRQCFFEDKSFVEEVEEEYVKGELIVVFEDPKSIEKTIEEIEKIQNIEFEKFLFNQNDLKIALFKVSENQEEECLEKVEKINGVKYSELNNISSIDEPVVEITESFTGTITIIEDGKDGSTITLKNEKGEVIKSTISIPNLGPNTDFDFSNIKVGNKLRVSGSTFEIQGVKHLTAKHAITMFSKDKETKCIKEGGSYDPKGMLQVYMCNMPAKDFGKSCTDSSECEGMCLSETKSCSKDTINFGCINILEEGNPVTICID